MSISSSSGLCKAIRISLIATYPDKNYVSLSLHNLEHKKYFKESCNKDSFFYTFPR